MNAPSLTRERVALLGIDPGTRDRLNRTWCHLGVVGLSALDILIGFLTVLGACWLSPAYDPGGGVLNADPGFSPVRAAVSYAVLFSVVSHVFGLHDPLMPRQRVVLVTKYLGVAGLAVTLLMVVELMLFYTRVGRQILVFALLFSGALLPTIRFLFWRLSEESKRRVVVLGPDNVAARVRGLIASSGVPYEMVPPEQLGRLLRPGIVGGHNMTRDSLDETRRWRACGVDEVVAFYTDYTPRHELERLSQALLAGVHVSDYTSFMERTFFRVPVEHISPEWFFQLNTSGDYALYRAAKRMADLFVAAVGMLLAGPLLVLAAVLIRLESRGAAFYSQVRVGQFGRPFRIWKLRSMRNDAERAGAQWAAKNDSRVTTIGRILRCTRFDEVPQFINVLRGDMSFIGPRPERPEFVRELAHTLPFYDQRHLLRPGITGWAQINYPYGATQEDALNKLKYDLYYIKHASLMLDIQIVLRTIGAVMKGAR